MYKQRIKILYMFQKHTAFKFIKKFSFRRFSFNMFFIDIKIAI